MKTRFFNIDLDIITGSDVLGMCRKYFHSGKIRTVYFLNAHCFNIAKKNKKYLEAINRSDLLLNDGIGVRLASILNGVSLLENLNGTDLIPRIIGLAEEEGVKVFLLGGKEHVPPKAAGKLAESYPGLIISGYRSGYFTKNEEMEVVNQINRSGAGLLILGMGVPKQELWADENKSLLKHVRLIVAGGAILDFISGEISRAPLWIRKINMEWAYRLCLEPKRMWKRYITGNFLFLYHILRIRFFDAQDYYLMLNIEK